MMCTELYPNQVVVIAGYKHVYVIGSILNITNFQLGSDLKYLTLKGNNLTTFEPNSFKGLLQLIILQISDQPNLDSIPDFAFENLESLTELSITNCSNISHWSQHSFHGLHALTNLNLSHTAIAFVGNMFFDMHALMEIDLSHSSLMDIDFTIFRLMEECTVHVKGTTNLTHVQVGNVDELGSISVITDSPMVCCSIGTNINCSGPTHNIDWCGTGLKPYNRVLGGALSFVLLICSISSLITRSSRELTDKYIKMCLLLRTTMYTMIAAYGILIVMKDIVFPIGHIYQTSSFKFLVCGAAGILQMVAVVSMPGLGTFIASAYYKGINRFNNIWDQNLKRRYALLFTYLIIVTCWVVILFTFLPYRLTDMCSLVWSGIPASEVHYVVGILLLSNHALNSTLTFYQFWKAHRIVKTSQAAVRDASGYMFGRVQGSVVRFWMMTNCIPFVEGLLILSIFDSRQGNESTVFQRDLIISLYIFPCTAIAESLIYLARSFKTHITHH